MIRVWVRESEATAVELGCEGACEDGRGEGEGEGVGEGEGEGEGEGAPGWEGFGVSR